jgi:hypothetical protein
MGATVKKSHFSIAPSDDGRRPYTGGFPGSREQSLRGRTGRDFGLIAPRAPNRLRATDSPHTREPFRREIRWARPC